MRSKLFSENIRVGERRNHEISSIKLSQVVAVKETTMMAYFLIYHQQTFPYK
jgi:hypothetical protein